MKPKVFGFGINNATYNVTRHEKINGKWVMVWRCPYHAVWTGMIGRVHDPKYVSKYPTYKHCSIHEDWAYFMTFRAWMMSQDWEGKHLDKDILSRGNNIYSPETCRFVDGKLNMFLTDRKNFRGEWPIGVYWNKSRRKFISQCQNPFTGKNEFLGAFICPNEAHEAWRKYKHYLACKWADIQKDPDIAEALRKRFEDKGVMK